jgi:hypothetical protein
MRKLPWVFLFFSYRKTQIFTLHFLPFVFRKILSGFLLIYFPIFLLLQNPSKEKNIEFFCSNLIKTRYILVENNLAKQYQRNILFFNSGKFIMADEEIEPPQL